MKRRLVRAAASSASNGGAKRASTDLYLGQRAEIAACKAASGGVGRIAARARRQAAMEGHRAHRRARVGAQLKRTMGRARPVAMAMARLGRQWERNHPGPVDSIACRGLGSPCARQAVELGTTRTDDWVAWYRGIRSHRRMPPARATKHGKETGLAGAAYLGLRRLLAPDTAMLHRKSTSAIVSIAARQSRRHRVPVHVTPPRRATACRPPAAPAPITSASKLSAPRRTGRLVLRLRRQPRARRG